MAKLRRSPDPDLIRKVRAISQDESYWVRALGMTEVDAANLIAGLLVLDKRSAKYIDMMASGSLQGPLNSSIRTLEA